MYETLKIPRLNITSARKTAYFWRLDMHGEDRTQGSFVFGNRSSQIALDSHVLGGVGEELGVLGSRIFWTVRRRVTDHHHNRPVWVHAL